MSSPLISIVIPTYNQAHYLREALDSVRAQTHQNWEALIINNHSTDSTRAVVLSYQEPRFQLTDFANEGVIAAARNYGMRQAKGRYLAFLDSDDRWHPQKLETCLRALTAGVDLVCHGEYFFSELKPEELKAVTYGPQARASYESLLIYGNCISTSAVVARTDLLQEHGGFDERRSFIVAEDYDLWLRLAKAGATMRFLPEMLGDYRLHASSASASSLRVAKASFAVMTEHRRQWHPCSWREAWLYWQRACRVRFFIQRHSWRQRRPFIAAPA